VMMASAMPQAGEQRAFNKLIEAQQNAKKFASQKTKKIPTNVLERNDDYNIVMIPASTWACTKEVIPLDEDPYKDWQSKYENAVQALGANQDTVTSKMFKRLFQYIVGVNSKSASIEMTAPVTNEVVDNVEEGKRSAKMCFWLGEEYNPPKVAPEPIKPEVFIEKRSPTIYFAKRFSGWALSNNDWETKLGELKEALEGREEVDDSGVFFTVSFDSPFYNGVDRRNEVWIPKKEGVSLTRSQRQREKYESLSYIVRETTSQYELREYGEERWACTEMEDINPELDPMNDWQTKYGNNPYAAMGDVKYKSESRPANEMFMRMFRYIQGVNNEFKEIKMTVPVPTTHMPDGSGTTETQEMCFWMGSEYRSEEPPSPIPTSKIEIKVEPSFKVFVREFGGWAMADKDYRQEYEKLKEDLDLLEERYDPDNWIHVSYNSPFDQGKRRNEVWIPTE